MPIYIALLLALLLTACDGGDGRGDFAPEPEPTPDFTEADAWLQDFVDAEAAFDGASIVIVDREKGAIHKAAFGDQTEDSVVLLASVSKVPTVTLMMALAEDDNTVNFDIDAPIAGYLPWLGVWDQGITTEHLLSNRSGIPGILNLLDYGAHQCQYAPFGTLLGCAQVIYQTPLPDLPSSPPDTAFDYGGSQWQLAGAVAETVGGAMWQQLFDQYIGEPCGLEVFRYGNNFALALSWDGNPDSLVGLDNPNIEGGAISNLDDYARLISLHLNDGACGENQVLSPAAVASMRSERTPPPEDDWGYAMGWWTIPPEPGGSLYLYVASGTYGSVAWIDTERNYGGVVFFEEYSAIFANIGSGSVVSQLIPIIEQAIDAVR